MIYRLLYIIAGYGLAWPKKQFSLSYLASSQAQHVTYLHTRPTRLCTHSDKYTKYKSSASNSSSTIAPRQHTQPRAKRKFLTSFSSAFSVFPLVLYWCVCVPRWYIFAGVCSPKKEKLKIFA